MESTPAIGTTEIQGRGRSMISLRPIKGGEIILRDSPLLLYSALRFHSNHHTTTTTNTYCSHCFTTIPPPPQTTITCPTCTSPFCSPNCLSTASTTSHTPWVCQTLIKLYKYFSTNPHSIDIQIQTRFIILTYNLSVISPSKFQTLLSLQGSVDSVNSGNGQCDVVSDANVIYLIVSSLCSPLELGLGFNVEMIRVLLVKDKLNAFGLMEPFTEGREERSVRAYGIYPVAALFNHDCLPNACRFDYLDARKTNGDNSDNNSNTEIVIRMIHDVPEGREVCLSYFPVNLKYSERQKRLRDDYGFVCDCDRCKVEAGWSESDGEGLAMDDDGDGEEEDGEGTMDEDVDERMEGEDGDGDEMKGEDDFPHAYFFLNYMCDRTNCWGTLAPLPPSVETASGVMECNVCGGLKKLDQV